MNTNTAKAIDSYNVWVEELKKMVEKAKELGIPKSWSEDYIIAMLPAVFREGKDVQVSELRCDLRLP